MKITWEIPGATNEFRGIEGGPITDYSIVWRTTETAVIMCAELSMLMFSFCSRSISAEYRF